MRTILIIIIGIHGVIHLFGFLKAFEIFAFKNLSQTITKPIGVLWLITFVLFMMFVTLHKK